MFLLCMLTCAQILRIRVGQHLCFIKVIANALSPIRADYVQVAVWGSLIAWATGKCQYSE